MRATPVVNEAAAADAAPKPLRFWRRLAEAFDSYLAERTKRAIPEFTLRRSKREIDRCRRLMHRNAMLPAAVNANRRRVRTWSQ
jgi:hypothetical protein